MASDTLESLGQILAEGNNVYISVYPTSKEEADRIVNALSQGGDIEMAIADGCPPGASSDDQPWGDCYGSFKDKFGVQWLVNYTPPQEQQS